MNETEITDVLSALPVFGDVLPNGATVVAAHAESARDGHYDGAVVLARTGDEFATWILALPPDRPAFCTSGHYFPSIVDAASDYASRGGR